MIEINNQELKNYGKPFIVAEAGINHNGELIKAFKMIEVAKLSGADAVKFQTFRAEEFCGDKSQMFTYQSQGQKVTESMYEMFKRYEFDDDDWFKIKKKCDDENILFLSTPQNRSDLDLLIKLDLTAIKVGSDDFTNLPLLADYSKTKLPMIVSCGMSDLSEVHDALDTIGTSNGVIKELKISRYTNDVSKYFDFWRFLRIDENGFKDIAEVGDIILCKSKKSQGKFPD